MLIAARLRSLVWDRGVVVYLGLVAATTVSWWVGSHGAASAARAVVVVAIGCAKARYVGLDFMELRRAPAPLRLVLEIWIAAAFVVFAAWLVLS